MPALVPSSRLRAMIAAHPTPLRSRFGCSDFGWHARRALVAPVDPWVAGGRTGASLEDLLRMTPRAAVRALAGFPTVVVSEHDASVDFPEAVRTLAAMEGIPRFLVLPTGTHPGALFEQHPDSLELCNRLGIVVCQLHEVERLVARTRRA